MYRKRWIKLSLRRPHHPTSKKLFWQALTIDKNLARRIDDSNSHQYDNLPEADKDYSLFVSISINVATELLPAKPRSIPENSIDAADVVAARKATLRSATRNVQTSQINLR